MQSFRSTTQTLTQRTTNLTSNLDTLSSSTQMVSQGVSQMGGSIGGASSVLVGFSAKMGIAVSGIAALIAAAAPAVAAVGGLTASFAAAGIGVVGFAAVATSALGKVFEASEEVEKLEEKIANATTSKQRIAAQKELAAVYGDMSKAQRGALKELQSFKSFWGGFTKQFEKPIFQAFGTGLEATRKVLDRLAPTITNVSGVVNELMNSFNKSIGGNGAAKFFEWLETNAAESIRSFTIVGGNLMSGFFSLMQAFAPHGAQMEEGLVSLTAKFKSWASSLEGSTAFQNFINYAKQNGPALMTIIGNIATIFKKLIQDLAPFGATVLSALQSFTSLIINNWSTIKAVIVGVASAFLAFKAVTVVIGIVTRAIAVFNALKRAFAVVRTAFTILRLSMLLFPGGWIIAAIGAVVMAGIWLYKNWDTVKAKALELWDKVKKYKDILLALLGPVGSVISIGIKLYKNWDEIKAKGLEVWNSVKTTIGNAMDSAKTKVSNFFEPLMDFIDSVTSKWKDFTGAISSFKMPKFEMPSFSLPSFGGGDDSFSGKKAYHGESFVHGNNKPYLLHHGERVLTAKENKAYTRGLGGGITIAKLADSIVVREDADIDRIAEALVRRIEAAGQGGA